MSELKRIKSLAVTAILLAPLVAPAIAAASYGTG